MRKITLLMCAMAVSLALAAQSSEPELKQLWSSTDYSWNTANRSRDIAIWDGNIYVPDNNGASSAIHVIDAATGVEDAGAMISNADFQSFCVAVDNAGHLLLPKNTGGSTSWILSKVDIATGTVTTLNGGTTMSAYRTDYLAILGNIESTDEPAYVIGASCNNPQIQAWELMSGDLTATAPFVWTRPVTASGADIKWIDDTHALLTQQSNSPVILTVDFSNPANFITEYEKINLAGIAFGGGAYFELDDTPYLVFPATGLGDVGIYDISDIDNPVAIGDVTDAIGSTGNGAAHVGIEVVKEADDKVNIYVWSPNNGGAAYEFSVSSEAGKEKISLEDTKIRVKPTASGIEIQLDAASVVELYTVGGVLVDKTIASGTYAKALASGVYVVRVNGQVAKFVR